MILGIFNFIKTIAKIIKTDRGLKKGELALLPNDDVRTAVMSWMWGKFNRDWTNQYEVIQSLPKPCQDVYACYTVVDEVNNGGFNQLFLNPTREFSQMAQKGFIAIGSEELSGVLGAAIEIYEKNKELLEKYNDGTIESFSKSYNEKLFDELDDRFSQKEPEFENQILTYIRNNESVFGD